VGKESSFQSDANVYTAFRDNKTYKNPKRNEIAKTLFTIRDNTDFNHCLNGDTFIFNNKTSGSTDYHNQNCNFDRYYNCGATAAIQSSQKDNIKNFMVL